MDNSIEFYIQLSGMRLALKTWKEKSKYVYNASHHLTRSVFRKLGLFPFLVVKFQKKSILYLSRSVSICVLWLIFLLFRKLFRLLKNSENMQNVFENAVLLLWGAKKGGRTQMLLSVTTVGVCIGQSSVLYKAVN